MNEQEEIIKTDDNILNDEAKILDSDDKNPFENIAREMGWYPKKDSENDKEWIDAETFVKNTALINKKQRVIIDRLENDLETIKRDVKKTLEHQTKSAQQEIEKLKNELKQKKREAITDGDVDAVEKIDAEINKLDEETEDTDTTITQDPLYVSWLQENQWYDEDSSEYDVELQKYADKIAKENKGDNLPLKTIFKIVNNEIELYKLKKERESEPIPKKRTQTDVIDTRHKTVSKQKKTAQDLPMEFVDVGKRFVKDGIYKSVDEYAEDYFKFSAEND